MNRRIGILCALMILTGSLAGCGGSEKVSGGGVSAESNVAEIKKDGAVTNTIEEELDPELYGEEDSLKEFLVRESNQYNSDAGADRVSIKKIEMKDDMLTLVMEYAAAEDFGAFNEYPFFYGTVADAYENGYDLDLQFVSAEGDDKEGITREELLEMGSRKIVIVQLPKDELLTVDTGSKILYYAGDAVTGVEKSRADMAGEGLACLVFK